MKTEQDKKEKATFLATARKANTEVQALAVSRFQKMIGEIATKGQLSVTVNNLKISEGDKKGARSLRADVTLPKEVITQLKKESGEENRREAERWKK